MATFSEEKLKAVAGRYLLARFTVSWAIPPSEWISDGSLRSAYVGYEKVDGVAVNGVEYTETPGNPKSLTTNQWFHDHSGDYGPKKTLYVFYGAGTPNSNDSMVVIVRYGQFVCQGLDRRAGYDPGISLAGDYDYQGRILSAGPFNESWENALSGVITIGDASLTLANADDWIQEHVQPTKSIRDNSVKVWLAFANSSDALLIYSGSAQSVSISDRVATIQTNNSASLLNAPCYVGDAVDECIFSRDSSLYPNIPPKDQGKPLRYTAGVRNYTRYTSGLEYLGATNPANIDTWILDPVSGSETATCVNYTQNYSASTNLTWVLGRIPSNSLRAQSFGTLVRSINVIGGGGVTFTYIYLSGHNLIPGETISWTISGGTTHAYVTNTQDFTYLGLDYNVCAIGITGYVSAGGPPTLTAHMNANSEPSLMRGFSTGAYFYIPNSKYTTTFTPTSGGNYIVSVTIDASYGVTMRPDTLNMQFVMIPSSTCQHGTVVSRILTGAGVAVDSSSITSANADFNQNAFFTIPNIDESEYRSYKDYLADILYSVGSYLSTEIDGSMSYHVMSTATALGDAVDESSDVIGRVSSTVDYNDIVTELNAYNPHFENWEATDLTSTSVPVGTATSNSARYLYGRYNPLSFRHVLKGHGISRLSTLLRFRSVPRRIYSFSATQKLAEAILGDSITITTAQAADGSANARIVSRDRSLSETLISAVELP